MYTLGGIGGKYLEAGICDELKSLIRGMSMNSWVLSGLGSVFALVFFLGQRGPSVYRESQSNWQYLLEDVPRVLQRGRDFPWDAVPVLLVIIALLGLAVFSYLQALKGNK